MLSETCDAKYASMSHGSKYPVKPKTSVTSSNSTPTIHCNSRGDLYAPQINTCSKCKNTSAIIADAPQ